MKIISAILLFLVVSNENTYAQIDSLRIPLVTKINAVEIPDIKDIPLNYINGVEKKVDLYAKRLNNKTIKTLTKLSKWENKIKKILDKTDPKLSKELFADSKVSFNYLLQQVKNGDGVITKQKAEYNSYRDKLTTSFKYLEENKNKFENTTQQEINKVNTKLNEINKKADEATVINDLIKSRKKELIDASIKLLGKNKYLSKINKDVWYYKESINNYKDIFSKPGKAEQTAKDVLNKIPAFKEFVRQNSMLSSLFKSQSTASAPNLAGLQTRSQVNTLINNQLESAGADARELVKKNMQSAQSQLKTLKDKILKQNSGGVEEIPDFKPNMQKTKTFLQRLEYGFNIQMGKTNSYLPSSSEFALSIGYKLNDKSLIGLGASYKLGVGSIDKLKFTHEGIGLRSFIDWKLKKQFYVSGGFEMNHNSGFKNIAQLKDFDQWTSSGLVGITRKIPIKTKFTKNTKLQLLYDVLHNQHTPRSQSIIFRVGYNF